MDVQEMLKTLPPDALNQFRRMMLGDVSDLPDWATDMLRMIGIEPPLEGAERVARELRERGLEENVRELEEQGYTVIRDAFDADMAKRIEEGILACGEEDRRDGVKTMGGSEGPTGQAVFRLVERGRVFEEVLLHPKLTPVLSTTLGRGYVVATFTGMIRPQGTPELPLHSDNQFMPAPFPEWAQGTTAVWYLEDLDAARGASRVVPGSHRRRRHPKPGEGQDEAVAVEAPKGSIVVWVSNTWHGNCARTAPGTRVTLHTAFQRMHIRPMEHYDDIAQEILDRNPPEFARLIGRDLPYDYDRSGPPALNMLKTTLLSHGSE